MRLRSESHHHDRTAERSNIQTPNPEAQTLNTHTLSRALEDGLEEPIEHEEATAYPKPQSLNPQPQTLNLNL